MWSQTVFSRALRSVPGYENLRSAPDHAAHAPSHDQSNRESSYISHELEELHTWGASLDVTEDQPRSTRSHSDIHSDNRSLSQRSEDITWNRSDDSEARPQQRSEPPPEIIREAGRSCPAIWGEIWLPLFLIYGSMLSMLVTLTVVVSIYHVKPAKGLFFEPPGWEYAKRRAYLWLSIRATRLTFIVARAPQFATFLAGPLMQLWAWRTAQALVEASIAVDELPTPYQFSLLIGICMASPDRLRRWTSFRSCCQQRRRSTSSPKLLVHAGFVLYVCISMAMIMFAADSLIHYTTRTVEIHQAKRSNDIQEFGKGLAQQCLSMDRTANYGLPCTVNNLIPIIDFLRQQNEMLALYHNTSTMSEIRTVEVNGQDVAILLPKTSALSAFVDFRASTIGITTQCRPITHLCDLVPSGIDDMFSQFTCSSNFWGLLGKTTNGTFDPDYPPLSIKTNRNIVMAYFMDKNLTVPYNSVGYNPITGEPDENGIVLPDDQLINEVHMALAMRFASTAVDADVDLSMDKGFYRGPTGTYDIILNCNYESLHVNYTWFNGTIRDVMTAPAPNGTLSEIWHGRSSPTSVSGDSPILQTILKQAAVQDSSTTFARKWAELFSPVVMATIGGVTSNRTNLLEQTREPTLVAKVSIPALTFLAFWCIVYIIFGTVLMVFALRAASEQDIRDARARLNVYGIVTWAVSVAQSAGREDHGELMPREQNVREERHLVGLLQGPRQNFYYKVFRGGGGI